MNDNIERCDDWDAFKCKGIIYEAGLKAARNMVQRGVDPLEAMQEVINEIHMHTNGTGENGKKRIMLEDVPGIALILEAKFGG